MKSSVKSSTHMPSETVKKPIKIFLGEDDLDDQDFFKIAFDSLLGNYEITCFTNGHLLLKQLRNLPDFELPSLIVLDYNLPILNGAEILAMLGADERYKNIPKLIWSTSSSPVCKNNCLENGAADYIVKPLDVEGLKMTGLLMQAYIIP